MVSDLIATSAAFCLFALFLFIPGYVSGWLLDIFEFRRRSLRARLAMSTPLSIGICPILTYLLWRWSLAAVWTMYAGCWIAFLALVVRDRRLWLARPRISKTTGILLAIVAGWVVLGMLSLVDMQIGHRLYFPSIAYDYMLRTAVTSSVTHSGVPPLNPYFFPGHPALLRYHYFWYLPCSLVNQLDGSLVSPRHAMLASALWSGIGLMSLVTLYLRFFQPKQSLNLDRRMLLGITMLGVTGLDILPVAFIALLGHRFAATIDGWNDQVTSWITSVFWVPHHVAGLIACLTGFLIIRHATARIRAGAIAGLMFASAVGLSVYVVFVFAAFLAVWLAITLIKQDRRQTVAICISGFVALAAAGTYLVEVHGGGAGRRSGGGSFLQATIRQFTSVDIIIETFWPRERWLVPVANLLLLPLNYYLELGFFFVVGAMQWRKMRGKGFFDQKDLCGFVIAATSVLICTFLRSGVISNNDLGWRGFLPAQFILLLWAVELWDNGLLWIPHRGLITALLILGVAGTVYEACMLRFYYAAVVDFNGQRTYALRQLYEGLKNRLPETAIVQHNPNAAPGDPFYGLYADRQAAAETSQCGVVFGGDPALCPGVIGPINDLFEKPQAVEADHVDAVCRSLSIDALVVKDTDKVWADKDSWVWKKQAVLANSYARAFLCGRGH